MSIELIRRSFDGARQALESVRGNEHFLGRIREIGALLAERFAAGNKVLICGNGGSACDGAHFAEELTGRFRRDRAALPAIACVEPGHLTCTANDFGYEHVFSRWVEALGRRGDVLIVLSTSGNSANVVRAVEAGRRQELTTVALLGGDGGTLRGTCQHELIAPGGTSDRIQEIHMLVLHVLVEAVEHALFPGAAEG